MNPVNATAGVPGLDQEEPEFNNERDIPQDDDGAAGIGDHSSEQPPAEGVEGE